MGDADEDTGDDITIRTLDDLREQIARLTVLAEDQDDEPAHALEDGIMISVLQSIADGTAEDPRALAALTLTTREIEFSRWCA